MSGRSDTNQTDVKRIKLINFNSTCESSDVAFLNLCLKSSLRNLEDNTFEAYKNLNNAGKKIYI